MYKDQYMENMHTDVRVKRVKLWVCYGDRNDKIIPQTSGGNKQPCQQQGSILILHKFSLLVHKQMCYSQRGDLKIGYWELKVKKKRDKVLISNLIVQYFPSLDFKYVGRNTASQEKKVFFLELYYMGSIFKLKISQ